MDSSDGKLSVPPHSSIPSSAPLSNSSMPKHTSISDEEESFDDNPHQTCTVPDNEIEVPVPPYIDPTDVVPVPTVIDANVPRHSACVHAPSSKAAEFQGIHHVPCVTQAVAKSCEAGHCLKEQRAQAKFEHRQQVLDSQASLTTVPFTAICSHES